MSEIDAAKSQAITFACNVSTCAIRTDRPKKKSFSIIENINWCLFFALSIRIGEVQNQFRLPQWLTKWLHETAVRECNNNRRRKKKNKKNCEVPQTDRIVWITNMTFDQRIQSTECLRVKNHTANDWFKPMIDNKIPNFNGRKCHYCYHIRKKQTLISRLLFPKMKSN